MLLALVVYALWVHPKNSYNYQYGLSLGIDVSENEVFVLVLSDDVGLEASINPVKLHDTETELELANIDLHDSIQFVKVNNMLRYLKSTSVQFYDRSTNVFYNIKKRDFDFSTKGSIESFCESEGYVFKLQLNKTVDSYEVEFLKPTESDLEIIKKRFCNE